MQLTFGDAEGLGQRKRTRREVFLAEMEQVVPWTALLALIAPHYPVCAVEPVDGAAAPVGAGGITAPDGRETHPRAPETAQGVTL